MSASNSLLRRDWWPFTRLVITAAVLAAAAHLCLGWKIEPGRLLSVPGQMLAVLSILAMVSFVLADLYLLLFLIPLYGIAVLNDWFYAASRWICRVVFRINSGSLLALGGLCGEIFLVAALAGLLRMALLR